MFVYFKIKCLITCGTCLTTMWKANMDKEFKSKFWYYVKLLIFLKT